MTLNREMIGGRVVTPAMLRQVIDRMIEEFTERLGDRMRVDVVATPDDLPAAAAPTRMFRVSAQPDRVYVGNGAGRPLSWFQLTPLS